MLEHSRIYYFYNNGNEEIYLSSADIMQRNLDRRVETTFPVEDEDHKKYLKEEILYTCLEDNQKSRILLPTGLYVPNRLVYNEEPMNHQEYMMNRAVKNTKKIIPIEIME